MNLATITPDNMPTGSFEIREDAAAREFLAGINVLQELEAKSGLPHPCIGGIYNHRTHWIVGLWYRGYKRPEENGFLVMGFSRATMTKDEIKERVKRMLVSQASETLTQPPYTELERKNLFHD